MKINTNNILVIKKIIQLSNNINKKLKKVPKLKIHLAFIIMSFSYYIFTFTKEINFLHYPFLLLLSVIPLFLIYKVKVDRPISNNVYRLYFRSVFFLIIVNTIIYGLFEYSLGETVASIGIYSQIIAAYFLSKVNFKLFFKNFEIVAIVSILLIPLLITKVSIDVDAISNRETVEDSFYTFAGSFWVVIPFVLFAIIKKTKLKLALLLWVITIALNLLFLKRFILIDSLLLVFAISFIQLNEKKKIFNKLNLLLLLSIPVIFYFFFNNQSIATGLNATIERMNDQTIDVESFDRFRESKNYLSDQIDLFDLVIGRGLAGQYHGFNSESISLHSGWANFVLKGGVLLLMLVITPVLKALRLLVKYKKLPNQVRFSVIYILIQALRLSYINMHNYRPELLLFFCAIFVVMDYQFKAPKSI